ncbi:hypothetical protein VNI00_014205 [Paramarasmius palmivorus]|uniref:Uncharacterized protein n=1 Tax=Paramarasmius palmivorus TaxID=297713 RepID=A0AAW0BWA1_9AGAR
MTDDTGPCQILFLNPRSNKKQPCGCEAFLGTGKYCLECSHPKDAHFNDVAQETTEADLDPTEEEKPKVNKPHLFQPGKKKKKQKVELKDAMVNAVVKALGDNGKSSTAAKVAKANDEANRGLKGKGKEADKPNLAPKPQAAIKKGGEKYLKAMVLIPHGVSAAADGSLSIEDGNARAPTASDCLGVYRNLKLVYDFPEGVPFNTALNHAQTTEMLRKAFPQLRRETSWSDWSVLGCASRNYLTWGHEDDPTALTMWEKRWNRSEKRAGVVYIGCCDKIKYYEIHQHAKINDLNKFVTQYNALCASAARFADQLPLPDKGDTIQDLIATVAGPSGADSEEGEGSDSDGSDATDAASATAVEDGDSDHMDVDEVSASESSVSSFLLPPPCTQVRLPNKRAREDSDSESSPRPLRKSARISSISSAGSRKLADTIEDTETEEEDLSLDPITSSFSSLLNDNPWTRGRIIVIPYLEEDL